MNPLKKALLGLAVAFALQNTANAQCDPDATYVFQPSINNYNLGYISFSPDLVTFNWFEIACSGSDYLTTVNIASNGRFEIPCPPPLAGGPISAWVNSFKIHEVINLPTGFVFTPIGYDNETNDAWDHRYGTPGVANSIETKKACFQISATPEVVSALAPSEGFNEFSFEVAFDLRIAATNPDLSVFLPNGSWTSELGAFSVLPPIFDFRLRIYAEGMCPVSVAEQVAHDLAPFPNPASTVLQFGTVLSQVEVFDAFGKLVLSGARPTQNLDVSTLPNGIYHLRSDKGVRWFVVER